MSSSTIHDMTTGSPVKLIIRFMIPMCLGNIFQQFYNIADSIVAGQFIGVDALAQIPLSQDSSSAWTRWPRSEAPGH